VNAAACGQLSLNVSGSSLVCPVQKNIPAIYGLNSPRLVRAWSGPLRHALAQPHLPTSAETWFQLRERDGIEAPPTCYWITFGWRLEVQQLRPTGLVLDRSG
jgi:hypothetical protein